ncbi:MAG: glutamate-5-semialdehyde dehydrogenase [Angelakisella sp.]
MEKEEYVRQLGERAKAASRMLAQTGETTKNYALETIAGELLRQSPRILEANRLDMEAAEENGIRPVMLDRLRLDEHRIADMADALGEVVALPDPVGQTVGGCTLANGLNLSKVRVPLGVVGIIYESRPNVTVDAAALCLKAGNAALLRGGKEAIHTNTALAGVMAEALVMAGLSRDCVLLVEDTDRACTDAMMRLNGLIDVLIPRGGAGLIATVVKNATVPVIETGVGNCHLYLDSPCDYEMAVDILVNAKCSRPSVCNAVETLLVHREVAESLLPRCKAALDKFNVELRGCPDTCRILGYGVTPATEEDYATEFCDFILAVKVVEDMDEALAHIARYSTGHSEAIVTSDYQSSRRFTAEVDAAAVYVNASTRFTDGNQLGLGAEIGISTQKLHVRGPMGLESLTSLKYIILGDGQIRL